MKRASGRGVVLGLLASGGLLVTGCERSEEAGRPHTPLQEKYQDGTTGAASELDGREGLNMPDWQNHPTMGQGNEEAMQGPTGPDTMLNPRTPAIPAPEEDYQVADDIQAPRAPIPGQAPHEEAIGGSGDADQQPERR